MATSSPRYPMIKDVIRIIEEAFPPSFQEDFDNTGMQIGSALRICTGVLLCVDVTPEIVIEAVRSRCNLIISHHPLIFHPLKSISRFDRVELSVYKAIQNDISVYSCHTSVDNTPSIGVSWRMGAMLGLTDIEPLEKRGPQSIGSGIVGNLTVSLSPIALVSLVKSTFDVPVARCSSIRRAPQSISRVALCGGAGTFLFPKAIEAGAQAFITSDSKHNHFIDYIPKSLLIDIGHFESEKCTTLIFAETLESKIPQLPIVISQVESNPVNYL